MLVPPREHDVIIPWDIHFPSRAEALGFLEAIKWTQPGALYDERYWTLGEAIRWIAERTPDAVDQAIASAEACEEATKELQEALEAGEISSTACLPNDSVPRQVPPETWGTQMVCLRTEGLQSHQVFRSGALRHVMTVTGRRRSSINGDHEQR